MTSYTVHVEVTCFQNVVRLCDTCAKCILIDSRKQITVFPVPISAKHTNVERCCVDLLFRYRPRVVEIMDRNLFMPVSEVCLLTGPTFAEFSVTQ